MPSKNVVKQYLEGGFYHIYNRGVDKRTIFEDALDYRMFLSYLKNYLSPRQPKQVRPVRESKIFEQIQLICYCLMPNHFHLLIKQGTQFAIVDFMRRITNAYTKYFNERYKRVGPLFQGRYKAVLVTEEPYLLHLTRYIHLNPAELSEEYRSNLLGYTYSSYGDYLGKRKTLWLHPEEILGFFRTVQKTKFIDILSYESFVEDSREDPGSILNELALDYVPSADLKQVGPV